MSKFQVGDKVRRGGAPEVATVHEILEEGYRLFNDWQGRLSSLVWFEYELELVEAAAVDPRDAEIERLKARLEARRDDADTLRARVEELEAKQARTVDYAAGVAKERDALQEHLAKSSEIYYVLERERDALRAEVEQIKGDEMNAPLTNTYQRLARELGRQAEENARLKAELEALRPKPVVYNHVFSVQTPYEVLKVDVKYIDGKRVKAEVIR